MPELRNAPRTAARQRGTVVVSGRAEIPCTIRDLSSLGARLGFMNPTILPRSFRLLFDGEDQRVTVMWQAGVLAGVRFHTAIGRLPAPKKRAWPWSRK